MRRIRLLFVGLLAVVGVLIPAAANAAPAAPASAAASTNGCPSGDVCIYPEGADWTKSSPILEYYKYGTHPFQNLYNNHWIFNNQTGGAIARVCYGSDGTGCSDPLAAGWAYVFDFSPLNSVVLAP